LIGNPENKLLFSAASLTLSLGVLGVMGAMLSRTGIFGMAAYTVSKRMRELGIHVALGAPRKTSDLFWWWAVGS
jgi:ABC-type antimicrobial peptide transport system permease subunit